MKNKIIFSLSLLIFTGLIVYTLTLAQGLRIDYFNIYKGWNLVSLAVMGGTGPEGLETTCSPKDLIVLYGYDPLEKRYVKIKDITEVSSDIGILGSVKEFYKETNSYLTRSPMNSGWLYSTKNCEITMELPSNFTLEYIQPLGVKGLKFPAGWNFFTVLSDMVNKNFEEIRGDCIIEKVYVWAPVPEGQVWMNWKGSEFSVVQVGSGVVFKTANDCLLGEKVTILGAPALPE